MTSDIILLEEGKIQHNIVYFAGELSLCWRKKYGKLSELIKNEKPLTSFEGSTKF